MEFREFFQQDRQSDMSDEERRAQLRQRCIEEIPALARKAIDFIKDNDLTEVMRNFSPLEINGVEYYARELWNLPPSRLTSAVEQYRVYLLHTGDLVSSTKFWHSSELLYERYDPLRYETEAQNPISMYRVIAVTPGNYYFEKEHVEALGMEM